MNTTTPTQPANAPLGALCEIKPDDVTEVRRLLAGTRIVATVMRKKYGRRYNYLRVRSAGQQSATRLAMLLASLGYRPDSGLNPAWGDQFYFVRPEGAHRGN